MAEDPKIVKIAKLVLLLTDKNVDTDTKLGCLKLDINSNLISQDEAMELLMYLPDLKEFMED